jgi:polyisoprenoid-binding protein YceI
LAVFIFLPLVILKAQNNYVTSKGIVSFFAEAPVTDVDAQNESAKVVLNAVSNEIIMTMNMADFKFKNQKMGRDAEKKYLETEKFKDASFRGKINGIANYHKAGTYPVTATGKMKIHGVERELTEKGTIVIEKDQIKIQSAFSVLLKDYNIETPTILGKEMTAEKADVKISATLNGQSGHL